MRPASWIKLFIFLIFLSGVVEVLWNFTGTTQAIRFPAAIGEAPKSNIPKVELDRTQLISLDEQPTSSGSGQQKALAAPRLAVAPGKRLMAVVDNDCLANKPQTPKPSLSERAFQAAEKDGPDDLKLQAYSFIVSEAYDVDQLIADADADECVQSVSQDRILKLVRPNVPSSQATSIDTQSATTAPTPNPNTSPNMQVNASDVSPTQQAHLNFLNAKEAWALLYKSGHSITKDVVVAVVDSGVDYNHPDLADNMWHDAAGNTGYDFVHNNQQPMDDLDHGTHVAGLIGALENSFGVTGIMSKHVKIMAVKIINSNDEGTLSDLVNGLHFAADHGADVINLSLGGEGTSSAEEAAVRYATSRGAVVVVAAGNSNKSLTASTADYPAGYAPDVPGMISVGSIDTLTGARSSFSNYSPEFVYIAAPGSEDSRAQVGLLSTLPSSSYGRMEGTSMATPIVAGAIALAIGVIKSEGLLVNNVDVIDTLLASAKNDSSLVDSFKNGNVLNLERLARLLKYKFMIEGDAGAEDAQ